MTPRFETSERTKEISSAVIFFPDTNARGKENMFIWCDWHRISALREHNHLSLFTAREKDKELFCDSRGRAFIIKHSLPRNCSKCILETNKKQDWEKNTLGHWENRITHLQRHHSVTVTLLMPHARVIEEAGLESVVSPFAFWRDSERGVYQLLDASMKVKKWTLSDK